MPWKIAMWGSYNDQKILTKVSKRFMRFDELAEKLDLNISQGIELRKKGEKDADVKIPEIIGKLKIDFKKLKNCGMIFTVPPGITEPISKEHCFGRKGRVQLPLGVCHPPHILVDASCSFAIYLDSFLLIPARQIGISGNADQSDLLKALSIYLCSNFVKYHQFFTSPQSGIKRTVSTLDSLKRVPIPFNKKKENFKYLVSLHTKLIKVSNDIEDINSKDQKFKNIMNELNNSVYQILGLKRKDSMFIEDFINYRQELNEGKMSAIVINTTDQNDMLLYAKTLQNELNSFIESQNNLNHNISIVYENNSSMLCIELVSNPKLQENWYEGLKRFWKVKLRLYG